jgi:Cdc6-like AAA superfamily ATPase
LDDAAYIDTMRAVGRAFSPAAPITDRDLLAGRQTQLRTLARVVAQCGQHALIYGERGVGKTSVARVTQALLDDAVLTAYYTCNSEDVFETIWTGILGEISVVTRAPNLGFGHEVRQVASSAVDLLAAEVGPHTVVQALGAVSASVPLLVIIDEFDRPTDPRVSTLMADTIKILADRAVPATVILVGVADSVEELVAEHESIQRALVQVQMPRMTDEESRDIVRRGMAAAGLDVEGAFVDEVAVLSQGLPHFAHLLGLHGATRALDTGRMTVCRDDFDDALNEALRAASQSVRERYHNATFSNSDTLYKDVLLACALADKDDMGSFAATDVRQRLREITHRDYEIPAFAAHLKAFSVSRTRGGILKRIGTKRRFRYRFRDPLMPSYIVMKGRVDGLI